MATENNNSVYIKWSIDQDAFLQAFPGSTSVEIGTTTGFAFINYEGEPPVTGTHNASIPINFTVQPRVSQPRPPRPTPAERYADHTKVICNPNVSENELPANAQLITIKDVINEKGTGRIYKNFEYETKHSQSIQFTPAVGAEILSDVTIGGLDIKIISITVLAKENRVTTFIRVLYKKTGQIGDIVLRRIVHPDGTESYSRRCFNILTNPDDLTKSPEDIVNVQFISVESITLDPETGLWSDLKLAIDEANVPLSAYRFGGRRRRRFTNGGGNFRRFGGNNGGRFRGRGRMGGRGGRGGYRRFRGAQSE